MRPEHKNRYTPEKFGRLDGLLKTAVGKTIEPPKEEYRADLDIKNLPPQGEWVCRGVYRTERNFAWGKPYGRQTLQNPKLTTQTLKEFGAEGTPVYLDLETTGLSGGTGSYAFLVGLGLCEKEYFKVVQLFLAGPGWEKNWLAQLEQEIPDKNYGLVTYNGATFDLPLLRTRYMLARTAPKWNDAPHMDLLRLSRHFYRGRLDSCSLSSIEQRVLGVNRSDDDIPGNEIPWLYTHFLQTQDARPLAGVFYHNTLDIVSLAALQNHLHCIMRGKGTGWEQLRAGDLRYKHQNETEAIAHWQQAENNAAVKAQAKERLADYARQQGDYTQAQEYLKAAVAEDLLPCEKLIKLAKIEEHKTKELAAALAHASEALRFLEEHRFGDWHAQKQKSDIRLRIARLKRKMSKNNKSAD